MYALDLTVYRIAREVSARLDTYTERAREGKDLQAAKDFASYVQWSGTLALIEHQPMPPQLVFDCGKPRKQHGKLLEIVHEQFRGAQKTVSLELSQIELINHRLDLIAGRLARMPAEEQRVTNLIAV